jgi:hypothetical protein
MAMVMSAAGRRYDDSFFAEAAFFAFNLMFCGFPPAAVVAYENDLLFDRASSFLE